MFEPAQSVAGGGPEQVDTQTAALQVRVLRSRSASTEAVEDWVAVEEPLELRLVYHDAGGQVTESALSITMRTPGHDIELGVGFLFAERIIECMEDIRDSRARTNQVTFVLGPEVSFDIRRLVRHFFTSSSCGVCGRVALETVRPSVGEPLPRWQIGASVLRNMPSRLRERQTVFSLTAGVHAAGLFDRHGQMLAVYEDIGRHNAVDKAIGSQILLGSVPLSNTVLVVSGRTSFDILQKAAVARIPFVVAVGAPSSLAIDIATNLGITLLGFVSSERFNVYTGEDRIRS